ncbi:hypothetical protein [Mucilaginibacter sp. FT3.2]|uniref:hypothetical protein n=1 Tax=Mucilaginibacter sp. FT3.2 TaxID=2723090 RepID=UPI0016217CE0|nr:hypothetical protein [Mucilaginibacter sp. FT3.2]MBB6233743.1 uncharacterized membrane protein YjjP (DUF1212 family) [Mucilaginibacter sp. FT3.2]
MAVKSISPSQSKTIITIFGLGFLTGTLDGIAAVLWSYITNPKIKPNIIFEFIASGVFGRAAFTSGSQMVVAGVFFHYFIAFLFSAVFYLLYGKFDKLIRNKYLIAVLYGIIVWLVMNLIVVPLSKIGFHPIKFEAALIGLIILIVCIGLPVALIADKKYWAGKFSPKK